MGIEYSNFKSRVGKTRGYEYVDALHEVWAAMLQTSEKYHHGGDEEKSQ
jgi:hypothetical protein